MEELPKRKQPRLEGYDYSQNGAYFVTICTDNRLECLGRISVGRGDHTPPHMELSTTGQEVERYIQGIETAYRSIRVDKYVIMPNHVHMIIVIDSTADGGVWSPRPTTLLTVIRSLKTMVTKALGHSIWQSSFYDHIIRNQEDYLRIWQYIDENPAKWAEDEYYRR